ncbi:MAG: hypothetical protein ABI871_01660 [Chthoniobacterales bacterium]
MDKKDIRALLSVYRADELSADDPRFEEARKEAESDPDIARWWAREQELDRIIGEKLQSTPVPAELKAKLMRKNEVAFPTRPTWARKITLLAAAIVLLAVLFSSWRGPFQPAVSLADYRDEMVGFVKVQPSLELETKQMPRIKEFLEKSGAPMPAAMPKKLEEMEPVGCRTLRFRGKNVSLICFKRREGKLLHLLVVDRAALSRLPRRGAREYATQGEWMTATWTEGNQAYLMTVQGDRATLDRYLGTS